ncbi:peroxidase 7 [Ziziphus jujuba]|uniref:Peroxidase n=1 Tax=Ziziphus jujuba TaxID=326968 RepID=A0ABM3I4R8_ZIZJJ|nr:peroxidase 7 [Ziziphus jujuba]
MKNPSISFIFLVLAIHLVSASAQFYPNKHEHEQANPGGELLGDVTPLTIPTLTDKVDDLLSFGYYQQSCPNLEAIISRKVKDWVDKDFNIAASLLRLHFHDCAVRGCDASILLNHEGSERNAKTSKTLRGFEVIDDIKAEVERQCPKTVSCADILTAATRDATVKVGGPYWSIPYGRKDGRVSIDKEAESVPMGHENVTALMEFFQSQGLSILDLVVLSGAHTIGRSSCEPVQDRVFNYRGTGMADPSVSPEYLNFLRRKCRWASEYVELDASTPWQFDNKYFTNLQKKMGLLYTDQILYSDLRTSPLVATLASNPSIFRNQFGVSMAKLGNVQVLTGQDRQGEIRTNCNFVNNY